MSDLSPNAPQKRKYDLEERTAILGEQVILLAKKIPYSEINKPLISQLIRSATSIGANYMEADVAESKKDFQHKIGICKKETKETLHWLRLVTFANSSFKADCDKLKVETHELLLIFASILNTCKINALKN